MSDDRRSTNDLQDEGKHDVAACETTVLDFVKRGKVRRGALKAVLSVPDDRPPESAAIELAELARALDHSPLGEKRRSLQGINRKALQGEIS